MNLPAQRPSWWPDLDSLPAIQRREIEDMLVAGLGPVRIRYCPAEPTPKQETFLRLDDREVFYGGAAGPGKTWGLLMAALQYCDVPGYSALLLRRTLTDLEQPGNLIELSHEWLHGVASWNGNKRRWTFPSGAVLQFGYLKTRNSHLRYRSTAYQFIGFEELTEFDDPLQYLYLLSRLRKPRDSSDRFPPSADGLRLSDVPLRMRAASNPGGDGHEWVQERFVDDETREPGVRYLPATMRENPHLDQDEYERMLDAMDEVTRLQLLEGDWDVMPTGGMFDPMKAPLVDRAPDGVRVVNRVRWWDMAATAEGSSNGNPDYTVGLLLASLSDGTYMVEDIVRGRWGPDDVDRILTETADADVEIYGRGAVTWYIGQEGGSAGKSIIPHYRSQAPGVVIRAKTETGAKDVRARPAAADWGHKKILVKREQWARALRREVSVFPSSKAHDDQVDALSGAHGILSKRVRAKIRGGSARRVRQRTAR